MRAPQTDTRDIYYYVRALYQTGHTATRTVESTVLVFTCAWPLRKRLALAWRLVTGR